MMFKVLPWRGIRHISLATNDLDQTIVFYRDVLAMAVSGITPATEMRGRSVLVLAKQFDDDVLGLHFIESLTPTPTTPLLSIGLRMADSDGAMILRVRLEENEVIIQESYATSFAFLDNNGLLLDILWPQPKPQLPFPPPPFRAPFGKK